MPDNEEEVEKKPKSMLLMNILVSSILGFVCGGLGFAAFTFMPGLRGAEAEDAAVEDAPAAFIPFGEVVVNLGDSRMSRYLRINLTLQVQGGDDEAANANVESNRAILRNWLIGYLSDLQLEDIRGGAGQNRIRREIQNYFNDVLAPDGTDFVNEILFEEFTVQ